MGLCAGNCVSTFNPADYRLRVELAQKILEGNLAGSEALLRSQIAECNKRMEFEKSKNLHSYLADLEKIFEILKTGFSERKYVQDITAITTPLTHKIERPLDGLKELQKLLQLKKTPVSLDCFDISHFQSSYIVGSCIRFTHGAPDKNKFRRFKIKTLAEQNDYAALHEIVQRRYRDPQELPDIIVIDGGKGQLHAVNAIVSSNNLCQPCKERRDSLYSTPPRRRSPRCTYPYGATAHMLARLCASFCSIVPYVIAFKKAFFVNMNAISSNGNTEEYRFLSLQKTKNPGFFSFSKCFILKIQTLYIFVRATLRSKTSVFTIFLGATLFYGSISHIVVGHES